MWRADSYDAPQGVGESLETTPWWSGDLAHQVSVGDSEATPVNGAAQAWETWRDQIRSLGGPSPLIHFQDRNENRIDLSRGHPGGLARFLAGSPTLLVNLIRDDMARKPAHKAAGRLVNHALELLQNRGLDTMALGIGLVEWKHDGVDYCGPLLMRPVRLRRRGKDFELTLRKSRVRLNPGVQRAFAQQLQVTLDPEAFVALTDDEGAFKPNPALDRLRDLTAHRGDVSVVARLVVSSFAELVDPMLDDASNLEHNVLDALGSNTTAVATLRTSRVPVEVSHPDRRSADTDRFIADANPEQDAIVANIQAGNSLVVQTPPGTGATQVVVNALGGLIANHKRVLIVTPRPASTHAIKERLVESGLRGMAVEVSNPGRDIIASIGRNEKAKKPTLRDVDAALERLRKVILRYREALSEKNHELGVSALDCFSALGRLSLSAKPPETTARLDKEALVSLAGGLGQAAELLAKAAELGEFKYGPDDSPWYGVSFTSLEDARKSQERAKRLSIELIPKLLERIEPILAQTLLPQAKTVGQIGMFLNLLMDIRDTLDRFQPSVFDRSLRDLIRATGPGDDAKEMPRIQRRRLKALAKEHVRPGVHVGDVHEWLIKIQAQRDMWLRFVETGHQPSVPGGLGDLQVLFQQSQTDIAELDRVLGRSALNARLADMPTGDLVDLLAKLSQESEILHGLEQRQEIADLLAQWRLQPLVEDLATRHVDGSGVAKELAMAWWRGALETILDKEEGLLGSDTEILQRLEADFRLVDEAHAAGNGQLLGWQLADRWSLGLMDWPEEAQALKKMLKNGTATVQSLNSFAPHLTKALAPVWVASPYDVHHLPHTLRFDAVFVLDAAALRVGETLGALRRAPQVVAFGDPVAQTPRPFTLGMRVEDPAGVVDRDEAHDESLFAALRELVPTMKLEHSYRSSGDDLARVVSDAFYGGQGQHVPWAGSFLGHPALALDVIEDGQGMPDPITGIVEGVDAEVRQTVSRVIDHALSRPTESLMVLTASAVHAGKVHDALGLAVGAKPEIADFFTKDSREPFLVVTLDQAGALTRDRVIFSLGYGRTPHGRVLSDLGPLSQPGGERLLAVAFTRARRHLRVLSCVSIEDLRDERLSATTRALGDVLHKVDNPPLAKVSGREQDPLLVDLAKRLDVLGMNVELDYQGHIPLAASYGGYCIALDTDTSLMPFSVREALRLRPAALAKSGWHWVRAHSLELFTAPDAVALRIATLVGLGNTASATSDDIPEGSHTFRTKPSAPVTHAE